MSASRLNNSLSYGIEENRLDLVKKALAEGADPNAKDISGLPMLHYALLKMADIDILDALVKKGADINVRRGDGITPLMTAIRTADGDAIEFFVKNGADPTIRTPDGKTAMDMVAEVERNLNSPSHTTYSRDRSQKAVDTAKRLLASQRRMPLIALRQHLLAEGGRRRKTRRRKTRSTRRR